MDTKLLDNIDIYSEVNSVLAGGHLLAVYRECDAIYAENMLKALVRHYRVTKKVLPTSVENDTEVARDIAKAPDDVRLIVVFGGFSLLECAKVASTMMGLSLIVVQTTAFRMAPNSAYIFERGTLKVKSTVEPRTLLIDRTLIGKRSGLEYVVGNMAERVVELFDNIYKGIIRGAGILGRCHMNEMLDHMNRLDEEKRGELLDMAYRIDDASPSLVGAISEILARHSEDGRCSHSYRFGLAYTILLLYKGYIEYDGDDLLYPPDIVYSAQRIAKKYSLDISPILLSFRVMSSSEYMRARHIAREYREELLDILTACLDAMSHASKVYRRVSKDAGYKMYENVHLASLLENISLFSICERENTPLRIMKAGGFLERYAV